MEYGNPVRQGDEPCEPENVSATETGEPQLTRKAARKVARELAKEAAKEECEGTCSAGGEKGKCEYVEISRDSKTVIIEPQNGGDVQYQTTATSSGRCKCKKKDG